MKRWLIILAACGREPAPSRGDAARVAVAPPDAGIADPASHQARHWPGPCRITYQSPGETWNVDLTYDDQGRVVHDHASGSAAVDDTFSYDGPRLVEERTSGALATGVSRFRYDAHGKMIEETWQSADAARPTAVWSATYDARGRTTKIEKPFVETYTFTYDAGGRMASEKNLERTMKYHYDREGRLTEVDYGSNGKSTYEYGDGPCRPTPDPVPRGEPPDPRPSADASCPVHVVSEGSAEEEERRTYDDQGRLVRVDVTRPAPSVSTFTYDAAGNLIATTSTDPDAPINQTLSYECWK